MKMVLLSSQLLVLLDKNWLARFDLFGVTDINLIPINNYSGVLVILCYHGSHSSKITESLWTHD